MSAERPQPPSPVDVIFASVHNKYARLTPEQRFHLHNVIIFPGQGTQHVGMGEGLAVFNGDVRVMYDEAEKIFPGIKEISFKGPEAIQDLPSNAQPAIFLYYLGCWLSMIQSKNGEVSDIPAAFTAHSYGIVPALVAAGAVSFRDGLGIAIERGRLTQQACEARPGKMVVVYPIKDYPELTGLTEDVINEVIKEARAKGWLDPVLNIAFINSRTRQVGIGGDLELVQLAEKRINAHHRSKGLKTASLDKIGGAFHTLLMASAQAGLRRSLEECDIRIPKIPVIFNGKLLETREQIIDSLVNQLIETARFDLTTDRLKDNNASTLIEVSRQGILSGILERSGLVGEISKIAATIEAVGTDLQTIPSERIKLMEVALGFGLVVFGTIAYFRHQQQIGEAISSIFDPKKRE